MGACNCREYLKDYLLDKWIYHRLWKNLPTMQETQVLSLVGKILWRREWQTTPLFLPGESHGKKTGGYSSWGCKESKTMAWLTLLRYLKAQTTEMARTQRTHRRVTQPLLAVSESSEGLGEGPGDESWVNSVQCHLCFSGCTRMLLYFVCVC